MIKRLFDIFLSSMGIIGSSPLWLLFSLAIIFEEGLPIFYLQERVGKGGRIFRAMKFRSMIRDAEKDILRAVCGVRLVYCNFAGQRQLSDIDYLLNLEQGLAL